MSEKISLQCSLVIRCYNEEHHIGKLLSGIMEQTIKNVEILIVDSGSTDATLSIASRFPVKILSIKPEEFSFGSSLNKGCAASTNEFIIMASAHVYPVYRDWLEKLLLPFNDPEVAIVYGKQRGDTEARYSEQQIYKKWYPDDSINCQKHPFCNNANAAIRRSLWERLPYNEDLTGLEDLDWAKRAVGLGKKIFYSAEAEIIHIHNETRFKIYNRYKREAIAFKHIFPHEHFHFWDFLKLFTINSVTDYYHAWKDRMLSKNFVGIPIFRLMQFWGTYRGFRQRIILSQQLRNRFYYAEAFSRKKNSSAEKEKERRIHYEHR